MTDDTEIRWMTLDEATEPPALHVGVNAAGRSVRTRFTPYRIGPQRLAELINQVKAGMWRLQLDEASAAAAGNAYANRPIWVDPAPVRREEAIRMMHESIARARGASGGGKSNALASIMADMARQGVQMHVVDPDNYLTNVTWPTQKADPAMLVRRIDQVVAEAEKLAASIRMEQRRDRNMADLRRMFGNAR